MPPSSKPSSSDVTPLTAESLAGVAAFKDLDHAEREAVAARCVGRRYRAHQFIVSHRDPTADVFFIVSGEVRVTHYSASGKEVAFRDLGAGDSFGELSAIDAKKRSVNVVTLTDAFLGSLSARDFWEMFTAYPAFARSTLRRLSELVRLLTERVIEFSTLGVKNRIHAELLRLAKEHSDDGGSARIAPAPTHADIASRVSTHREAVTRELNALAKRGLIERRRGALLVRDMDELERMVRDVTGS